jgi:hypothetical protein
LASAALVALTAVASGPNGLVESQMSGTQSMHGGHKQMAETSVNIDIEKATKTAEHVFAILGGAVVFRNDLPR